MAKQGCAQAFRQALKASSSRLRRQPKEFIWALWDLKEVYDAEIGNDLEIPILPRHTADDAQVVARLLRTRISAEVAMIRPDWKEWAPHALLWHCVEQQEDVLARFIALLGLLRFWYLAPPFSLLFSGRRDTADQIQTALLRLLTQVFALRRGMKAVRRWALLCSIS